MSSFEGCVATEDGVLTLQLCEVGVQLTCAWLAVFKF